MARQRRHGMVLTCIVGVAQALMTGLGSAGLVLIGAFIASGFETRGLFGIPLAVAIATGAIAVFTTWVVARLPWRYD